MRIGSRSHGRSRLGGHIPVAPFTGGIGKRGGGYRGSTSHSYCPIENYLSEQPAPAWSEYPLWTLVFSPQDSAILWIRVLGFSTLSALPWFAATSPRGCSEACPAAPGTLAGIWVSHSTRSTAIAAGVSRKGVTGGLILELL